jgi:hypothetical protein
MTAISHSTNLRGARLGVSITPGKELAMTEKIDHRAILARVEQIIDLLRTCYVRDGWKLDEEGAERTLRYFRHCADSGQDDNPAPMGRRGRIRRVALSCVPYTPLCALKVCLLHRAKHLPGLRIDEVHAPTR